MAEQAQTMALMQIGGRPVIEHVIRWLTSQGVREIAINLHYHADQIMQLLGDGSRHGVQLYCSREEELLDSGGGVKQAIRLLPGEGPFVLHNADIIAHVDIGRLARHCPSASTLKCNTG